MGLFDFVKEGAQELFIARPDEAKDLLVYKWPDRTIPNHARLTVGEDEIALFYKDGRRIGQLSPGLHRLDSANIAFLSVVADVFTGGNAWMAEVWFITTRECGGKRFGGKIGTVQDPQSRLAVDLLAHGEYSLKVQDPSAFIGFFGQRSWSREEELEGWFKELLLKVARECIAEMVVKEKVPLVEITSAVYTTEIERRVLQASVPELSPYGMRVVRLGNFEVAMKDEDAATLKSLFKDAAQIGLAGGLAGFGQLAAGKALIGAGEGMAKGGEGGMLGGVGLGVGFGMAPALQPTATVGCPSCGGTTHPGRFCSQCGAALAAECAACHRPLSAGAKFCAECGAQAGPKAGSAAERP